MTTPVDTTFVSGTTITSEWLNGVNDAVIDYDRSKSPSVKDEVFGAVGDGITNDTTAFSLAGSSSVSPEIIVPAGNYYLATNPTVTGDVTWIVEKGASFTGPGKLSFLSNKVLSRGAYRSIESDPAFYSGIFGYLEQNAAETGYGVIGLHGVAQTAGGTGSAAEADIGVAGFAVNNLTGGNGGAWALYGTALREAGVTGSTHGAELDIANIGATVPLFPATNVAAGLTSGLWIGSGGESTNTPGAAKTASVAISILSNDPAYVANFDKGILFHNRSIAGTDGATGNGTAIAFAKGHSIVWFNNSNQAVGEITCNNGTDTQAQLIQFTASGITVNNRLDGGVLFNIQQVANAVNYIRLDAAVGSTAPRIQANGVDANIDLILAPKGTGVIQVPYGSTPATTPSAFVASRHLAFKDGNGILWYIPLATSTW